jgi:hypothetical protein
MTNYEEQATIQRELWAEKRKKISQNDKRRKRQLNANRSMEKLVAAVNVENANS